MTQPSPGVVPPRAPATSKKMAAAGLTGVALATSLVMAALTTSEGEKRVDYLDLAKVPTACFGHTGRDVRVGQHRTAAECQALLASDAGVAMDGVLACVPALRDQPQQLAASTSLAFNIGTSAFCQSGTALAFRRGDWRKGCDLMLAWDKAHVGGKLVRVPGLAARRARERTMCLTGLAS